MASPTIHALLTFCREWSLDDTGRCYGSAFNGDNQHYLVSREALAAVHPKLPLSLRAIITHRSAKNELTGKYMVRDLVDMLTQGLITYQNPHGQEIHFLNIHTITRPPETPTHVTVRGVTVIVLELTFEGENIKYVGSSENRSFLLSRKMLDIQYPTWEERLDACVALGIEGLMLGHNVFTNEPAQPSSADLGDLHFD